MSRGNYRSKRKCLQELRLRQKRNTPETGRFTYVYLGTFMKTWLRPEPQIIARYLPRLCIASIAKHDRNRYYHLPRSPHQGNLLGLCGCRVSNSRVRVNKPVENRRAVIA